MKIHDRESNEVCHAKKLGLFKLAVCRNYNPRRHPVAITLFYNFCRFYFTIPMIFEKQQDIESDLRESPLIFHGNYKQTSKNDFLYYLYHKSNEIYQLHIKIDELFADATVFLGKWDCAVWASAQNCNFFVKSDKQLRDQPWQKAPSGSSKPLTQWKHIQYRSKLSWESLEPRDSIVSSIEYRVSSIEYRVSRIESRVSSCESRKLMSLSLDWSLEK